MAHLVTRFHRPVPTGRDLLVRSRHSRVDARKAFAEGELWDGDDLCVSANGLFVVERQRSDEE
ncbi:PaaI family thioesterase [Gordonia sp. DT218]|uniref:PaaI family thioesterase n=1 Tax=unclassified Gordonia (in: high G+C Gram-positive bacteria) TaxID=2657482 RepID=UPI003CF43780